MRRDDVAHALDALASEVPTPTADAASLIARGRRRIVRQRVAVFGVAVAVIAAAAGIGAATNHHDDQRTVATPTTATPRATGHSRWNAVASSLEAWKCLNPLQYTSDGGRTWRAVAVPDRGLRELSNCTAVEGGNLWATDGSQVVHVRHATDVQVSRFSRLGQNESLNRPYFVDAEHGWIQTYSGDRTRALYRTTDGGTTWALASKQPGLGQLSFVDAEHGWSRYGNTVAATSDGGKTWQTIVGPRLPYTFQIDARGESVILWGGSLIREPRYRTLFEVSVDSGSSWIRRNGPRGFEVPSAGQNAFAAADASNWALASGHAFSVTYDGGATWQTRPDLPLRQSIGMVAYPTPDTIWLTSQTGRILRSTDSGRTWTDVTNGAAPDTPTTNPAPVEVAPAVPAQLAFASETEGWICDSRASYTTDDFDAFGAGGQEVVIPPNPSAVSGDYPQEPLCATAPGGNFWLVRASANESLSEIVRVQIRSARTETSVSPFNTSPFGRIEALDFIDANHGWALVTYKSVPLRTLYSTVDGGVNWSRLQDAPIRSGLEFENTTHGWSLSNNDPAKLAATTDSGRTWHEVDVPLAVDPPHDTTLNRVFVSGDAIVAYGRITTGNFFVPFFDVSTDGGRTWDIRPGPKDVELPDRAPSDFSAADAEHWALGSQNLLYVTDDGGRTWTDQEQFAGLDSIVHVARPSANAMFVSSNGDAAQTSTVVLGTINGGENWTTVAFSAPPMVGSGAPVNWPGGIVGCPTRAVTPAEPGDPPPGLVDAAFEYILAQGRFEPDTVSAAYKVGSLGGVFGELFRFHLSSCPRSSVANSWVVELHGVSGSGGGGSTPRAEVVLAHYADGWHVFGRYH